MPKRRKDEPPEHSCEVKPGERRKTKKKEKDESRREKQMLRIWQMLPNSCHHFSALNPSRRWNPE
jgi:hypothetical protein